MKIRVTDVQRDDIKGAPWAFNEAGSDQGWFKY